MALDTGSGANISFSRLVGHLLKEKMQEEADYDLAKAKYLPIKPVVLKKPGQRYPGREELHAR